MSDVVAHLTSRDVVTIEGKDAHSYLQSQLSQDIKSIGSVKSQASLLLEPTGRVSALVRVTYLGVDKFDIDVDPGFGEQLLARLKKFKIRVEADLSFTNIAVVSVRGDGAGSFYDPTHPDVRLAWWMDGRAVDIFTSEIPDDIEIVDSNKFEELRVKSGWPKMGTEITSESLPSELGVIPIAVNFGKGCYPGQELVERMDSRQATSPRILCRIPSSSSSLIDGVEVTSSAGEFALATVKRNVDLGAIGSVPVSDALR